MTSTTFHDAFLSPMDLVLAKRILDRICAERALEMDSREADELAASVIRELQHGPRDEERLMTLFGVAPKPGRHAKVPAQEMLSGMEMPQHAIR